MGQGLLLIEFAQHGEEALKIPATGTEGGGHVFVAVAPQERQQRVPQGSQVLGGVARGDLAGILVQGHVANVMRPVFDAPMIPPPSQQLQRPGQGARRTGDRVFDFQTVHFTRTRDPRQLADLGQAGPIGVARKPR